MRAYQKRKEAKALVSAINNSRIIFCPDSDENIWKRIIDETRKCKWSRQHHIHDPHRPSFEAPFHQGDSYGNGLPDIVYVCDDYVLGIEHFEFDSSGKTRKGSRMRIASFQANAELESKLKKITSYPKRAETVVKVDFSYDRYVQSLLKAFNTHMAQKDKYISALRAQYPGHKVYFALYIEDATALGSYINIDHDIQPVSPLRVREFIEALSKETGIDYIICRVQKIYTYQLFFQRITPSDITKLMSETYNMDECSYVSYHYGQRTSIERLDDEIDI